MAYVKLLKLQTGIITQQQAGDDFQIRHLDVTGDLTVSGTEIIVGSTTFQGQVNIGDGSEDLVTITSSGTTLTSDGTLTLGSLGFNTLVYSNAGELTDTDLVSWVSDSGGGNIVVADDLSGGVTLNTVQDIATGDSPTFAGLTVTNAINEFSTDGTLAGDSDDAVPTEKAVKTYVDGEISTLSGTLDLDLNDLEAAVGSSTGLAGLTYTEDNYVSDGESLESSVDALDMQLKDTQDDVDGFPDELKSLVTAEIQQLENIGDVTISYAQWGYVGAMNQGVATTDDVTFDDGDFTGNVTISGTLDVDGAVDFDSTFNADGAVTFGSTLDVTGNADFAAGVDIEGGNLNITGLTANRLVDTDGSKNIASVADLTDYIAGTTNEVTVAGAAGAVTIGLPDSVVITTDLTVGNDADIQGNLTVSGTFGFDIGTTINEISIDGTLAGDSDDAVPTEKAVKTYIDNATASGALDHGDLAGLGDDDHSKYPLVTNFEADRGTIATNWTDLTDAGATTLHKHDHGGMDGLGDDDHTQYLLADGTRALTGNWNAGNYDIIVGGDLTSSGTITAGGTTPEIQFSAASGTIGVTGDTDLIQLAVDSVDINGALEVDGLTDTTLTASLLVATDGSKALTSVALLTDWIADLGSGNISVVSDGSGGVTLDTCQDICTGDSPTFAGLDITGNITVSGTVDGVDVAGLSSDFSSHTGDATIHFTEASIDHGSIGGRDDDDHTLYSLVSGARAFTGTVGGITPVASSDLATKGYVDSIAVAPDSMTVASGTTTAIGNVLYVSGNDTVDLADKDSSSATKVVGLARTAVVGDGALTVDVQADGILAGALVGATAGNRYYLSDDGGLTPTPPSETGDYVLLIGIAANTTDLFVRIADAILL